MNTKQNKCKNVHTGFVYIIIQLVKAKDKEKIMKEEKKIYMEEKTIWSTVDF